MKHFERRMPDTHKPSDEEAVSQKRLANEYANSRIAGRPVVRRQVVPGVIGVAVRHYFLDSESDSGTR
jgi:hypothetical protein